ncbi:DUF4176 domain-containing protein [Enterococcus sp. AZ192]|uniref:DUF4176 domain-containing protein n=1 Tax=unclassified Enterococcus TaxID=2608891 RepID=UPI003D29AB7D
MELLPIGTVVLLENGEQELMITSRFPLYNNEGDIGYFDYAGCFYPQGQFNEGNYFFNQEDIKEILFKGYESPQEIELRLNIMNQIDNTSYKKITIKETL